MTKQYLLRPRSRRPATPAAQPRVPTYPARPLAFRLYPAGWRVWHRHLDFFGVVERSSASLTKIVDGAVFRTGDLMSCSQRQVSALESSPDRASEEVLPSELCATVTP